MEKEKKLNIGLFIDTYYPMIDGVISVVDNYAKRLVKYANVTVFTIAPRDKKYKDNFPYKIVRSQKLDIPALDYDLAMPGLDSKFQKELKNSHLDIVHIHSPFSIGKIGLNYAKKCKIPCVATNHSQFKQDFFKATKSPALTDMLLMGIVSVFNGCDENWSVNEMTAELFHDYGLKKMPIVMPNGTDFYAKDYDQYDIDINEKYGFDEQDKVLMFVGRMVDVKNIPFLIDSFALLHQKDPSFKLFLVGNGTRTEAYKKKVASLGIENNVVFAGKVADKKILGSMYKRADLFVFPSFYDTDGIVKKEAACFKTPSLVIEKSFASSNIQDNVNGYISKNSLQEFCDRILQIFKDKKTYQQVCENAQKTVYINWDDIIERVLKRYNFLIERKKARNLAIKKSSEYIKTIRAVKIQQRKKHQSDLKKQTNVIKNAAKYPKTLKNVRKNQQ